MGLMRTFGYLVKKQTYPGGYGLKAIPFGSYPGLLDIMPSILVLSQQMSTILLNVYNSMAVATTSQC